MTGIIRIFFYFIFILTIFGCKGQQDSNINSYDSTNIGFSEQTDTVEVYPDGSVWLRKYYSDVDNMKKYIAEEGVFKKDSIKAGLYRCYYTIENSNFLMKEGCFKDNIQVGTWKHFYPNGNLEGINIYDSTGKQMYTCHFSENGKFLHEKESKTYTNYIEAINALSQNQKMLILFTAHASSTRKFEDYLIGDSNILKIIKIKKYLLLVLYVDDRRYNNMDILKKFTNNENYPVCCIIDKKEKLCSTFCYISNNLKQKLIKMLNNCNK